LFAIEGLPDYRTLDEALQNLHRFALVVFVSPNAIDAVFKRLKFLGLIWPQALSLGVMGAASRQALADQGLHADNATIFSPQNKERTDSETLYQELDLDALKGQSVLIVRGESGRDFLADRLQENGTKVAQVSAYRRLVPVLTKERQDQLIDLLSGQNDWVITSSEVLKTLLSWCAQLVMPEAVVKMQQQRLFVPHFRIAEVAKELGFQSVVLTASGDEKLLLALQSHND
jgi:uroporphyrinogen-III synthase